MLDSNKPLPEPMLTQTYVGIYGVTMSQWAYGYIFLLKDILFVTSTARTRTNRPRSTIHHGESSQDAVLKHIASELIIPSVAWEASVLELDTLELDANRCKAKFSSEIISTKILVCINKLGSLFLW